MKAMRIRQVGLTLVELMVVVAVMAVIAAVAYPLYTTQTQKARRADAKVALETIASAQERAYTLGGQYYPLTASTLQAQLPAALQGGDSKEGYYSITVTPQNANQEFTASATPKSSEAQASDSTCTTFSIDQTGAKTASNAKCW